MQQGMRNHIYDAVLGDYREGDLCTDLLRGGVNTIKKQRLEQECAQTSTADNTKIDPHDALASDRDSSAGYKLAPHGA